MEQNGRHKPFERNLAPSFHEKLFSRFRPLVSSSVYNGQTSDRVELAQGIEFSSIGTDNVQECRVVLRVEANTGLPYK